MSNFLSFSVLSFCMLAIVTARLSPGSGTDPRVHTLLAIMGDFGYQHQLAETWKGNEPCHGWFGIYCVKGQIKSIVLISMNLTGSISPRFADLRSVSMIDLSQNRLTGTIPFELTKMELRSLDLSYNQLHGKVPHFKTLVPNTEGNPMIVTDIIHVPSQKGNKEKTVILGLSIGILATCLLLIGGGCIIFYLFKKVNLSDSARQPEQSVTLQDSQQNETLEGENRAIPFQIIRDATDNFGGSNLLGSGGFGTVYKGKLQDGTEVAVKKMEEPGVGGKRIAEFQSEVSVLTRVYHRNLVFLHGYCIEGTKRLLVYQYMPEGALSRHLFKWKDEGLRPLAWGRRLIIALDVARGVEYLHRLASQSLIYIHRDLKPSNVLLGEDFRAKVSDFGLVKSTEEGRELATTRCFGTPGYIAPEYATTGRVTRKTDVYSFGVILMELITGQQALDHNRAEEDILIATWFRKMFSKKDSFSKAIDETMEVNQDTQQSINEVSELASHCCAREPEQRPDITHVVSVLSALVEHWKPRDVSEIQEMGEHTTLPEMVNKWKLDEMASSSGTS